MCWWSDGRPARPVGRGRGRRKAIGNWRTSLHVDRISREAAKEWSPRREPWVCSGEQASPGGAKETAVTNFPRNLSSGKGRARTPVAPPTSSCRGEEQTIPRSSTWACHLWPVTWDLSP